MRKLLTFGVLCAGLLPGQSDTTSLMGTISDPSGGLVSGAKVTLRSLATEGKRTTVSNAQGDYVFSLMPPGDYALTVEAAGFSKYENAMVELLVAQSGRLNVQLQIGTSAEAVEVKAAVSPLVTESAAQGTVIGEKKIEALPLNGRQFLQLALLVPGANSGGQAVQQNQFRQGLMLGLSVGGNRTNNTAFLLDGAINMDPDYSSLNYEASVDAVQEFQVQTAMFGAEYGHAGGQINAVTKGGSNDLHVSVWDFLRNNDLDARPFNLPGAVPQYQRNQFGATVGGPIVKNKLFFFLAWETLRLHQAAGGLTTVAVPTSLQRQGNFSLTKGGIFDPSTLANGVRMQYPNNIIPASQINPLAQTAMNSMPLANVPGTTSLYVNSSEVQLQKNDNYSGRIDYIVSRNLSLFGRYSLANERAVIPATVTGRQNLNNVRPQNSVIGATTQASSRLVNETRLSFMRFGQLNGLPDPAFNVGGTSEHLPEMIVAGYPTMGGAGQYTGTTGGGIVQVHDNVFQAYDNLLWQRGRHVLKFGFQATETQYNRWQIPSFLGNFTFNNGGYTSRTAANDGTGDILASLLVGLPQIVARTLGPDRIYGRQQLYAAYVADDIRLTPKLTLNLGMRYEIAPPMYDARYTMASIDYSQVPSQATIFATGKTGFYDPALFICGKAGYPRGCAYTNSKDFAPRVGAAWSVNPKTVVRAGFGLFYANNDANPLFSLASGLPNNLSQSLTANAFVPNVFGLNVDQILGLGVVNTSTSPVQQAGIDLRQRASYSPQWTLTVQRELRRDLVVEVGYLGNSGVELEQNIQPNNAQPNAAPLQPRRPFYGLQFAPGTQFPYYFNVQGNVVPAGFLQYFPHTAHSTYQSGFVPVENRFSGGLSWLSSYTFSKAITDAPQYRNAGGVNGNENSPPQNSFNPSAERGLASFNAKNRFVTSYVYDLPFGSGHKWLNNGPASWVLGGWQNSTIATLQSGFPFTVNLSGDTANVGAGTGGIYVRPNAVPGVSWQEPADQRTAAHYFNPAAFAQTPSYQFGNVGRNTVIGAGQIGLDFNLAKSFRIKERATVQFRAEFFNVLNHSNYNVIGRIINSTTFAQALSQLDPRELQFGLKASF